MIEGLGADGSISAVGVTLLVGHIVLFLATVRISLTAVDAYRASGDPIHRNLAVGFLLLVVGLSLDDFARDVLGAGTVVVETIELVPALLAIGMIYYALFYG